jgi:SAM-dependent methyltransferase
MIEQLQKDNHAYWMWRATGYSEVNQEELAGIQRSTWSMLLDELIMEHPACKGKTKQEIRILDIGCGPGFLSIILTELGYRVTSGDFASSMLEQARDNAGNLAEKMDFCIENAMDLSFADATFDVVLSRNLTWNLPDPKKAYKEWLRVLKPEGMLLVFDANWYHYLRDDARKAAYELDRAKVAEAGCGDYNLGANFDVMEEIANRLPMTDCKRPEWDQRVFLEYEVASVDLFEDIGAIVYSEKEKINYASSPMFMIKVVK